MGPRSVKPIAPVSKVSTKLDNRRQKLALHMCKLRRAVVAGLLLLALARAGPILPVVHRPTIRKVTMAGDALQGSIGPRFDPVTACLMKASNKSLAPMQRP